MPSSYDADTPMWAGSRASSPWLFQDVDRESEIVDDYMPAMPEDGLDSPIGATAQNNFKPIQWLYCSACYERVKSTETANHTCSVDDDDNPA